MDIRIWGTRGSYPVARHDVLRYGGNTACVAVQVGQTHIILDAGTGLRPLGDALIANEDCPRRLHMLITHTHWDHIMGFPFFAPIYRQGTHLSIYGMRRTQSSLRTTIDNAVSDPLLPIGLESLHAQLDFRDLDDGSCFDLSPEVRVFTALSNHPYRALGYRIESSSGTLVYIPDTGPFHTVLFGDTRVTWSGKPTTNPAELRALAELRAGIVRLAQHADWMIYDAQFTLDQYQRFPHWGHSAPEHAIEIATEAHVGELLLFHHDPHRTDVELDVIDAAQRAAAPAGLSIRVAYEGMRLSRGML